MRKSKILGYFLEFVNVAAVAVMWAVFLIMAKETLIEWQSTAIATIAIILTFKIKVSTMDHNNRSNFGLSIDCFNEIKKPSKL